jgi:ribosomal protein S18 acetylase RimI-like enzyme
MRADELADWLRTTQAGYVDDLVRDAGLEPEQAAAKAEEDTEQLFPGGRPSAEQFVFVVEAEGEPVGALWLSERENPFRMHIYNIRIDERFRGRGYGKKAMLLAEEEACRRGIDRISLNVYGRNTVARALYSSLGYEENAIAMSKRLQSPREPEQAQRDAL